MNEERSISDPDMALEHKTFCIEGQCIGHLPLNHPEYACCTMTKIVEFWQDRGRLPRPIVHGRHCCA